MHLKIITPLRTAVDAEVGSVQAHSTEGELEVLPGHTALITSLAPGELLYRTAKGEASPLFVGGGFLQVENDMLLVVTDTAMLADEMDPDSIQAAMEQARSRLRNESSVLSRREQTKLEVEIAKQMAMLEFMIKRKRRS